MNQSSRFLLWRCATAAATVAVVALLATIVRDVEDKDLPYGFFVLFRFVASVAMATLVVAELCDRQSGGLMPGANIVFTWLATAGVILLQPIIPVRMDRETWLVVDCACVVFLVLGVAHLFGKFRVASVILGVITALTLLRVADRWLGHWVCLYDGVEWYSVTREGDDLLGEFVCEAPAQRAPDNLVLEYYIRQARLGMAPDDCLIYAPDRESGWLYVRGVDSLPLMPHPYYPSQGIEYCARRLGIPLPAQPIDDRSLLEGALAEAEVVLANEKGAAERLVEVAQAERDAALEVYHKDYAALKELHRQRLQRTTGDEQKADGNSVVYRAEMSKARERDLSARAEAHRRSSEQKTSALLDALRAGRDRISKAEALYDTRCRAAREEADARNRRAQINWEARITDISRQVEDWLIARGVELERGESAYDLAWKVRHALDTEFYAGLVRERSLRLSRMHSEDTRVEGRIVLEPASEDRIAEANVMAKHGSVSGCLSRRPGDIDMDIASKIKWRVYRSELDRLPAALRMCVKKASQSGRLITRDEGGQCACGGEIRPLSRLLLDRIVEWKTGVPAIYREYMNTGRCPVALSVDLRR